MMKRHSLLFIAALLMFSIDSGAQMQPDKYLLDFANIVVRLQNAKGAKKVYHNAVDSFANPRKPKVTVMDDIGIDQKNEYNGKGDNPFWLTTVVYDAYQQRKGVNVSRGNYVDSRWKGFYYSFIEKNIKAGCTAHYQLKEHSGRQELIVMPFHKDAKFNVTVRCGGKQYTPTPLDFAAPCKFFIISDVAKGETIDFEIENQSASFESFAIMNYNARKP